MRPLTNVMRRPREDGATEVVYYRQGGIEPALDELLREPIIRPMMQRDNVSEEALLQIIKIARQNRDGFPRNRAGATRSCCPILSTISAVLVKRGSR